MTEARAKRWLNEAEGYLQLGLLDLAFEKVRGVEMTPYLPYECAALRGSILRERDDFKGAIPFFEAALQLRPGDLLATLGIGWCQKRVGRVDLAAQAYVDALKVNTNEAVLHYNLACYLSLLGRADEAVESLRRAFRIDADYRQLLAGEADFDPIRSHAAFLALQAEVPSRESPGAA